MGNDVAPDQSPVLVTGTVLGGDIFLFTASGSTSFAPTGPFDGPDGDLDFSHFGFVNHTGAAENGISDIRAPVELPTNRRHGCGVRNGFELVRAEVAERGVTALPVVEDFDVFE